MEYLKPCWKKLTVNACQRDVPGKIPALETGIFHAIYF